MLAVKYKNSYFISIAHSVASFCFAILQVQAYYKPIAVDVTLLVLFSVYNSFSCFYKMWLIFTNQSVSENSSRAIAEQSYSINANNSNERWIAEKKSEEWEDCKSAPTVNVFDQ